MNVIGNAVDQECHRWLNNRAENSHHPFRRRESAMSKRQRRKDLAKVRLNTRFDLQSFQSRPSSQQPRNFQAKPLVCLARMVPIGSVKARSLEISEIGLDWSDSTASSNGYNVDFELNLWLTYDC